MINLWECGHPGLHQAFATGQAEDRGSGGPDRTPTVFSDEQGLLGLATPLRTRAIGNTIVNMMRIWLDYGFQHY